MAGPVWLRLQTSRQCGRKDSATDKPVAVYTPKIMSDIERIREKLGVHPDFPKKVSRIPINALSHSI